MAMNFASTNDVDAQLRDAAELRAMLGGLGQLINNMLTVLTKREQSLLDCREALVAHLAERAAEQPRVA